jgi:hypothetical protein
MAVILLPDEVKTRALLEEEPLLVLANEYLEDHCLLVVEGCFVRAALCLNFLSPLFSEGSYVSHKVDRAA